jgi:hypothetical protein
MTRGSRDRPVPLLGCERGLVLGMAMVAIARGDDVARAAAAELLSQLVRAQSGSELARARFAIASFTGAVLRARANTTQEAAMASLA